MKRKRAGHVLALIVLACAPRIITAQTVRGTVVDADSTPVAGAVVMLRDSLGAVVARVLSGRAGEFAIGAPSSGTYDLRILRIGYRPSSASKFTLQRGETRLLDVPMDGAPVRLAALRVTGKSACEIRPDSNRVAFAIWEEARKALTVLSLTSGVPTSVRLRRYSRLLDPELHRVIHDTSYEVTRTGSRPFVSLPAETLLAKGFVQRDAAGVTYNAPDADVLLSERFLDTHCIRIAERSDSEQVGLQFAPVRSRNNVSDISGVLWFGRTAGQLDSLEYRYTNLPRELEEASAGGRVSFLPLESGGLIVSGWEIRMPQIRTRERSTIRAAGAMSGSVGMERGLVNEVSGVQLDGGDILEVRQQGVVVWVRR